MLLVWSVLVAWQLAAAPPSADAVGEAAREVLADGGYQTSLPSDPPKVGPGKAQKPPPRRRTPTSVGGPLSQVANVILWALMIAVVLAGLWWLVTELRAPPGAKDRVPTPEEPEAPSTLGRRLGDAEALAAAGQYAEAIHALLLDTVDELERRRRAPLAPSLTSREILQATSRLPEPAVEALGSLVGAVEVSHWAGAGATRTDYDRCAASFRRFVETCGAAA